MIAMPTQNSLMISVAVLEDLHAPPAAVELLREAVWSLQERQDQGENVVDCMAKAKEYLRRWLEEESE